MSIFAPHEVRVIDELADLEIKVAKLLAFIDTAPFNLLPKEDRVLLRKQFVAMQAYSSILVQRVARFTKAQPI